MEKFQSYKGVIYQPVLKLCTALGITANHISLLSSLVAILSITFSIVQVDPRYFLYGIWIHVFLDSLDGSLARYQGKSSDLGAFTDVVCDHIGIVASGFYLLNFSLVDPQHVLLFIILYTVDIYNLFITNFIKNPVSVVFRPRMFVHFFILIDYFTLSNLTGNLIYFLNTILLIQSCFSFSNIVKYLKKT